MRTLSSKTMFGFTVPLALIFLTLYIWQVNAVMSMRAVYEDAVRKIEELASYNQQLEVRFASKDAGEVFEERIKNSQSFEPVAEVVYLRILEGTVARSYTPE